MNAKMMLHTGTDPAERSCTNKKSNCSSTKTRDPRPSSKTRTTKGSTLKIGPAAMRRNLKTTRRRKKLHWKMKKKKLNRKELKRFWKRPNKMKKKKKNSRRVHHHQSHPIPLHRLRASPSLQSQEKSVKYDKWWYGIKFKCNILRDKRGNTPNSKS